MKYVKNANELIQKFGGDLMPAIPVDDAEGLGEGTAEMMREMMAGLPLHSILSFGGQFTSKDIQNIIDMLNNQN